MLRHIHKDRELSEAVAQLITESDMQAFTDVRLLLFAIYRNYVQLYDYIIKHWDLLDRPVAVGAQHSSLMLS